MSWHCDVIDTGDITRTSQNIYLGDFLSHCFSLYYFLRYISKYPTTPLHRSITCQMTDATLCLIPVKYLGAQHFNELEDGVNEFFAAKELVSTGKN
ncbi:hypothetical protein LAZ67_14001665 [Cordylochernes scorpioides]|uniref:Uncharacterized protein n=1 Tax=Cordylochernes scorpioides TaxID=51811 RepID=A0ABY6LA90_9ARAC|nr:hypothetical protein LAZ67_14001665 [Cordylochernes scorpioides]